MSKAFSNDYNKFRTGNDYINKKKAETIFESARNKSIVKENGEKYVGSIIEKCNGLLGTVGGYNVSSYDMLLNVAKGQSYLSPPYISIDSSCIMGAEQCSNDISCCQKPNVSYDIFEGPYLQMQDISLNPTDCFSTQIKQYTHYDISNAEPPNREFFIQLNKSNNLSSFKLHGSLPITNGKN